MNKLTWGTYKFKGDVQKCADEIMQICDDLQSATPQAILEKAKDSNTELHKCFTWDDTKAAEKWRLQEARILVCNIKIVDEKSEKEPVQTSIRFFYKTDNDSGYKPTQLILRREDEYKKLLERCSNELRAIKNKFQNLSEFDQIWELIN